MRFLIRTWVDNQVGEDAYFFLQALFAAHPQYAPLPFYVFGESFGGHYAPGVAHAIYTLNAQAQADLKSNKAKGFEGSGKAPAVPAAEAEASKASKPSKASKAGEAHVDIKLSGLGVGNGLTDPATQYAYYPEMAMNNSYGAGTLHSWGGAAHSGLELGRRGQAGDALAQTIDCL